MSSWADYLLNNLLRTNYSRLWKSALSADERIIWLRSLDIYILQTFDLNALLFLCYLRLMLCIFCCLTIIVLSILFSLNFIYGRDASNRVESLDLFSWINVFSNYSQYYWAQLYLLLVVVTVFCAKIYREMQTYLYMRQDYLKLSLLAGKFCTTVLITDILTNLQLIKKLRAIYDQLTIDDVPTTWINRNAYKLICKIRQR